jgi:hypothetical protein
VRRSTTAEQPALAEDFVTEALLPQPRRGDAPVSQPPRPPDTTFDAPDAPETLIPAPRPSDAREEQAHDHPVQLELALVLEQRPQPLPQQPPSRPRRAPDPDLFPERTMCIPHPRKPRW